MRISSALLALTFTAAPALAQHHGHQNAGASHGSTAPYAGFQTRAIKALSENEIADLRTGRGMSLALAAELNGHPGPMHVLEHAQTLDLSDDQRMTVEQLITDMRREASAAGEALIAAEAALDRLFTSGTVTEVGVGERVREVGALQAELRRIHLTAHIATRRALNAKQIAHYNRLRGY